MSDGNKRYLGDVFINDENYEYQKQFFMDIIESYQDQYQDSEGKTFNASLLQGKSADDFATTEQGALATTALQSGIKLGRTSIANVSDPQFILTDAINVDLDNPYAQEIVNFYNLSGIVNLTEFLNDLHNQIINSNSELRNLYDPFKSDVENFMLKQNGEVYLNASCVNGVSLHFISQSDYDELSENEKNDDRKIYFIRENMPFREVHAPNTNLSEFRVNEGEIQLNNGFGNTWRKVLDVNDLLESVDFLSLVQEDSDFKINKTSLINSIRDIESTEVDEIQEGYPFLSSSLQDDFIQNILINNKTDYVTTQFDSTNKIKTANLNLNSLLNSKINPLSTSITTLTNDLNTEKGLLATTKAEVDEIQSQITSIKRENTQQNTRISNVSSQISANQNNISQNRSQLLSLDEDIGNWESFIIDDRLRYTDSQGNTYVSKCILNRKLKLVYVYLTFSFYVKSSDLGKLLGINDGKGVRLSNTKDPVEIRLPVKPFSSSPLQSSTYNPWDNLKINDLGQIEMFSTRTTAPSYSLHYLGSWFFLWDSGQDSTYRSSYETGTNAFEE